MNSQVNERHYTGSELAIIGMAGRFPKSQNLDEFWKNLQTGTELISFFTDEELLETGIEATVLSDPNFVKAKAVLENREWFDADFFGINPREAEILDPQHRLFLECAWQALEAAGYDSETYGGSIGVCAGSSLSDYMLKVYLDPHQRTSVDLLQLNIASDKDFLTTRVSYKLNLQGPSYTVQTACSSSLVAIHLAGMSLLNGECDIALAGGVSINSARKAGYFYKAGGIDSPDGHCRAFDAQAQGTVGGEGVGIVVLKRLADALADGDFIYALIKGSAINNDGSNKVSYTAPRIESQAKVIRMAQVVAEVEPETISYIEAHGTGTALGDPIEIAALTQAFRSQTSKTNFCALGSVKTNLGHLDAAAGVAGLLKTILALKHQQIPPSLHFETPNPQIDFANSPFYVNHTLSEWKTGLTPRRAGVSSFGIGGTNAHVILEEAPPQEPSEKSRPWQLLILSAKTPTALETATHQLTAYLQQQPHLNLADVAYTLQVGRRAFKHRRAIVCQTVEDAIAITACQDPKRVFTSTQETTPPPVAFMFTGLGTQYLNMAGELYSLEPTFRETVDRCCQILEPFLGLDLRSVLYPASPSQTPSTNGFDLRKMLGRGQDTLDAVTQTLNQTALTQPAIFVIEYALAQLWMSWGIHPVAMIGYSIGEYVAATLAGVLSLEDALMLVAKRAQLIQALPGGAMLAVPLSVEQVRPLLTENLSLSAVNGASLCVVAGSVEAVDALATQLSEQNIACRRLQTSHAFHSHLMKAIAPAFTELVRTIPLHPPKIPYISNVTGTWIAASQATDPTYWTQHLCQPVLFATGLNALWQRYQPILLEVGPGQTLCSLALQCLQNYATEKVVLPSLRDGYHAQSDCAFLLNTLGQLWLSGVSIQWPGFYAHERRHRLPLPTYPFERQYYWIESSPGHQTVNLVSDPVEQKLEIAKWFYRPTWKQTLSPAAFGSQNFIPPNQCWLVFLDPCGVGVELVAKLEEAKQAVIQVKIGDHFRQVGDREYQINPQKREDYSRLIQALVSLPQLPQSLVHLWNLTPEQTRQTRLEMFEEMQTLGFYSLLFLAQALGEQSLTETLQIQVVSNNMQALFGETTLFPEKATSLGICQVLSQEYINIRCRCIDLLLPAAKTRHWQSLIQQLFVELVTETTDKVIAYRGNHRWVQDFEPLSLKQQNSPKLRQGGVYLITGGLGKLGLIIAEYLARNWQAKLVLLGRSEFPPQAQDSQHLASLDEPDRLDLKMQKVQLLEEFGAEVLVVSGNVSDYAQMQEIVKQVWDKFGTLHGVIHAAGAASASFIQQKTPAVVQQVFEAKVKGTLVLDAVLQEIDLDFFLLFSSLSSILGGLGQADYCAASAFLDAFAQAEYSQRHRPLLSINWDGWQENNLQDELMAVYGVEVRAEIRQFREQYAIRSQEGIEALTSILSTHLPQVIVSTSDLPTVIKQEANQLSNLTKLLESLEPQTSQIRHTRPSLKTTYVVAGNEIEQCIVQLYQELIGIEPVGIHDSFFELGGNSLMGIQLISRLCQIFQVKLSLPALFESPTVAELALLIEESIIHELQTLAEDEVDYFEEVKS